MKLRIAASIVIASMIMFGTSACNFFVPQSTTAFFDPSDGVSANVGDIKVRNAIVLIEDNSTLGSFVVSLVSHSNKDQRVNIQYQDADGKQVTQRVWVDADAATQFGNTDSKKLYLKNVDALPGALMPIFVQYGDETGVQMLVPILNGILPQYTDLVPAQVKAE